MVRTQTLAAKIPLYDETLGRDGSPLAHWRSLIDDIGGLSGLDQASRLQDITRRLRANGLAYEPEETIQHRRQRSLDLFPILFESATWQRLAEGLQQRARLKQAIYHDIYGPQLLLKERLIPPSMLYAHRGYLRDLIDPTGESVELPALIMHSSDVGRQANGQWQVLDDQSQYPSGLGYALENRVVLSRVLSRSYKRYRVDRMVSYFRQLQQHVVAASGKNGRCVLLSYASSHPHYFEFAWLAKYLGYPLVELADLTVRDHIVYLKTIDGLQPVDVIVRLIDDAVIDPMIIGSKDTHGIPGLVEAARRGGVRIINPMGTSVLDNPAVNTCLPELCQALLNEPLQIPSQKTLWLGDAGQRETALSNLQNMIFRRVDAPDTSVAPADITEQQTQALVDQMLLTPDAYVAQAPVELSLVPSLIHSAITRTPVALRIFQIASAQGFDTMPGALGLIDATATDKRHGLEDLAGSKDVWVLSSESVPQDTLLKSDQEEVAVATLNDDLPSRIAESEFWLGRNAERVEAVVRLLRRILHSLLDEERSAAEVLDTPAMRGLLRSVTAATSTYPGFTGRGGKKRLTHPDRELASLLQESQRPGTLANALKQWQFSASAVSDRLTSEQLRVFNRLDELQTALGSLQLPRRLSDDAPALSQIVELLDELLLVTSANTGLEHENITQSDVWIFKMLGRRIERAHQIAVTVSTIMTEHRDSRLLLEYLLRLFDSVMTYRARYRSGLNNRLVVQLLLLDEVNPRSLAYQFKCIEELIAQLPGRRHVAGHDPLNRLAVAGLSRVRLADPDQLLSDERDARQSLQKFLRVLQDLSASMADAVTAQYFTHTETRHQLAQNNISPAATMIGTDAGRDH
ncbi:MAG: circularly permuted type 2 ATP-grasp protein [Pseudomonadota bacterium]